MILFNFFLKVRTITSLKAMLKKTDGQLYIYEYIVTTLHTEDYLVKSSYKFFCIKIFNFIAPPPLVFLND